MAIATELAVDNDASATDMADAIFGDGVTVESATYSGDKLSSGIFTGGETTSAGVVPSDTGVILSTGHTDGFTNNSGSTNTNTLTNTTTNSGGVDGDSDFNDISPASTYDASFLEVEFVPDGDFITIDFVISSEEYPEFNDSIYNDVIGVWVNGQEATVSIGDGSASIGNINGDMTENLYHENTGDEFNTEMDGFSITLTFVAPVIVGETNTIKIGVADVGDSSYDTNLLIAGDSVQSAFVAQDEVVNTYIDGFTTLDALDNDGTPAGMSGGNLTVTHINGNAVSAGDTITLPTGQDITLNADGTFGIDADGDVETVNFNYTAEDGSGRSDTALVEINQVACFAKGTLIDTDLGPVAIEDLRIGMTVQTQDNGPQPIRWIGHQTVAATGKNTPVRIAKGTLGAVSDLWLSPLHQVLVEGVWAELLFGEDQVLVKARDLINDHTVTRDHSKKRITYYHVLFAQHQIITSNGVPSESYYPGPQSMAGFDAQTQAEITRLFPELCPDQGWDYGPSARCSLKRYEAKTLAALTLG